MANHLVIRTTQALGITSALFMSGIYFGSSYLSIHPLLPLPISDSTRIFADIYHSGAGFIVPLALGSAALNALSAYLVPSSRLEYGVAAAAATGTLAFTVAVMLPGIDRLLRIRKMDGSEIQGVQKQEVIELMKAWKRQNYVRALLGFTAGVLDVYAVVKRL
ncbi:hypothetical protein OHC33_000737 [Knufia fluminis]|uniref:DUF1772-domain-containing protein n=1 Tax=Knufia fluminis TaxID=191047 RepID=A0AAN8EN47_9EURO|nr:hypothetical protein OHC33_000737 [Knufia fluminis]